MLLNPLRLLALACAGVLIPLIAPAPTHATAGWVPDQALVVDIPTQFVDENLAEQRQALADVGLRQGDVVAVKWLDRVHDECMRFYSTCPYLDIDGDLYPVAEDHPFLVPYGPASLDETRTYPAYAYDEAAVEYEIPGYTGEPVYTDDPNRGGEPIDIIWDGTLLASSDESYDDDGVPYRRVAMGLIDLWVAEQDLAKAESVEAPFKAVPQATPEAIGVPADEPSVEPEVEESLVETTADTEAGHVAGVSESNLWAHVALGGGLLLVVGLVMSLVMGAVKRKQSA